MTIKFFYTVVAALGLLLFVSCAKLPVQSVSLMQQIKDEGQRMHKLNVAYINLLFENKNAEADSFMEKEYIPEYISNIKRLMDENDTRIDMNENWQEIFPKIIPVVNAVRDSLRTALLNNKNKIITKLNEDYDLYKQACDAQIALLSSATKINNTTRQIINSIAGKITGNKTDLSMLEQRLEGFLQKGETIAQKILVINDAVQSFTGNQ